MNQPDLDLVQMFETLRYFYARLLLIDWVKESPLNLWDFPHERGGGQKKEPGKGGYMV